MNFNEVGAELLIFCGFIVVVCAGLWINEIMITWQENKRVVSERRARVRYHIADPDIVIFNGKRKQKKQ